MRGGIIAGMPTPALSCSKCGAKLPLRARVAQMAAKCPQCGTLHKPPTYWESLRAGEILGFTFVLLGIAGVALCLCFALLMWALRMLTD